MFLSETIKAFSSHTSEKGKAARWVSAKAFRDFPFVNAPHAVADALKEIFVVVLFIKFFNKETVGYYYFALKIIRIPISLIGIAFAQVFYNNAADLISKKKSIRKYVMKNARDLFLISIVPVLVLMFFGEELFSFAFGSNWAFAGKLAAINAPVLLVLFVSSPLSRIPMLLNQQRWFFVISMFNNVSILTTIFIGSRWFHMSFEDLWIALTVLQFVVLSSVIVWYYAIVSKYEANLQMEAKD